MGPRSNHFKTSGAEDGHLENCDFLYPLQLFLQFFLTETWRSIKNQQSIGIQ